MCSRDVKTTLPMATMPFLVDRLIRVLRWPPNTLNAHRNGARLLPQSNLFYGYFQSFQSDIA
jgi:hypothetical protein